MNKANRRAPISRLVKCPVNKITPRPLSRALSICAWPRISTSGFKRSADHHQHIDISSREIPIFLLQRSFIASRSLTEDFGKQCRKLISTTRCCFFEMYGRHLPTNFPSCNCARKGSSVMQRSKPMRPHIDQNRGCQNSRAINSSKLLRDICLQD